MLLGSIPAQCNFYFSFNIIMTILQILLIVYLILSMIIYLYSNVRIVGIYVIIPCGIQMEIPYGMMESIAFHMDSRWNGITRMAGIPAKTYSIWNGWNPSGTTWIPHGFHLECGGTVKTSHILFYLQTSLWCPSEVQNQRFQWKYHVKGDR